MISREEFKANAALEILKKLIDKPMSSGGRTPTMADLVDIAAKTATALADALGLPEVQSLTDPLTLPSSPRESVVKPRDELNGAAQYGWYREGSLVHARVHGSAVYYCGEKVNLDAARGLTAKPLLLAICHNCQEALRNA